MINNIPHNPINKVQTTNGTLKGKSPEQLRQSIAEFQNQATEWSDLADSVKEFRTLANEHLTEDELAELDQRLKLANTQKEHFIFKAEKAKTFYDRTVEETQNEEAEKLQEQAVQTESKTYDNQSEVSNLTDTQVYEFYQVTKAKEIRQQETQRKQADTIDEDGLLTVSDVPLTAEIAAEAQNIASKINTEVSPSASLLDLKREEETQETNKKVLDSYETLLKRQLIFNDGDADKTLKGLLTSSHDAVKSRMKAVEASSNVIANEIKEKEAQGNIVNSAEAEPFAETSTLANTDIFANTLKKNPLNPFEQNTARTQSNKGNPFRE